MLNIFEDDAFSVAALTDSINLQPYVPQRIGEMGLFEEKNPRAPVVFLERKGDLISLIPTKPRGSGETTKRATSRRDIRPIAIPYVPYDDDVLASEVSGVRAFGTEEDLETVAQVVDEKMAGMRQDHEVTHEYMRLGAIKGVILDADEAQTPLLDLFDAFNITQHEVTLDLSLDDSALVKQEVIDIIRYMEDVLGAGSYDHIHAFVGNAAYDRMTTYPEVADAKAEGSNYEWLLKTQGQGTKGRGTSQFAAFDVVWENYRGKVGGVDFIESNEIHLFPVGVPGLFKEYFAPADTMTDVNKPGKRIYAMQEPMKFDKGMELHSESNPLMICMRPRLLVKITVTLPA